MAKDRDCVLQQNLGHSYRTIVRGEGSHVYDDQGKRYLDAASGVGVVNIGYGVEQVVAAIAEQARTLAFSYGGLVDNRPRQELASMLQRWVPDGMGHTRTLFCSGGGEANEAALKLAYQYHWERGRPTKRKVISRWQSYHGSTIATLSMSGRTQWRRMHNPYLLDFPHIAPPYSYRYPGEDIDRARELERVIRQEGPEHIAAFIAEPVIGTSMSAVIPDPDYYRVIREICDEYDVLFIADEVMSGVGRTGRSFGIDHWGVSPDIITAGKGISGGYSPLSATILAERLWRAIEEGSQTLGYLSTYGGNPVSCAAGVAALRYIEENGLVQRAGEMGDKLIDGLRREVGPLPIVGDVRGKGLFIGLEFVSDKQSKEPFPVEWDVTHQIADDAFDHGLIVLGGVTGVVDGIAGDHLEVLPPYVIEDADIEFIVSTLKASIERVTSKLAVG
ncbi:aspartate aminotransferase family protein [Actinomycetota bacterium]